MERHTKLDVIAALGEATFVVINKVAIEGEYYGEEVLLAASKI